MSSFVAFQGIVLLGLLILLATWVERLVEGSKLKAVADLLNALRDRGQSKAERRLRLALLFLPPGDRERYRQEWMAEMAGLAADKAARFAASLLASAPRTGASPIYMKIWNRRTA